MSVNEIFSAAPWLDDFVIIYLGLVLGSFATALAFRIPRLHDWFLDEFQEKRRGYNVTLWQGLTTRSRCVACEKALGPLDLVPVLSWLWKRGKCQHCGTKISPHYPLAEALSGLLFALTYYNLGLSMIGILLMMSLPFMIAALIVDFQYLILPDEFTIIMGVLGFVAAIYTSFFSGFNHDAWSDFGQLVLCGVVYAGFGFLLQWGFFKATGKEGLGWGDVKFFGVAGLWIGWWLMPIYLLLSSLIGIVFGLLWRSINKQALFPFGPALIIALYIVVIYRNFFIEIF